MEVESPGCYWCGRTLVLRNFKWDNANQQVCSTCRRCYSLCVGFRLQQLPEIPLVRLIEQDTGLPFDGVLKGIRTTVPIVKGELVAYYPGVALHRSDELFSSMDPRYFVSCESALSQFVCDGNHYSLFPVDEVGLILCDVLGPGINHNYKPNCEFDKTSPLIFQDSKGTE
jgi:hypothetical protein